MRQIELFDKMPGASVCVRRSERSVRKIKKKKKNKKKSKMSADGARIMPKSQLSAFRRVRIDTSVSMYATMAILENRGRLLAPKLGK